MDFSSDTSAPAHPKVIEAIAAANTGTQASYGGDTITARVRKQLTEIFETDELDVWMCASGTASNSLALSLLCPPTGAILCHAGAHIAVDERGAPEFFSGGGKLQLLRGPDGKIAEDNLREALAGINRGFVHETPADVLSITNLTENGTAYSVAEVTHYAALAHEADLRVHMDGARLANALLSTGTSPAEMTWRAGVDVLTLGLTKTGAIGCELIILFGEMREKYAELQARAKRSGHMPAKMRFIAAQAEAMLSDNLWLNLAGQANTSAQNLASILLAVPEARLAYPVQGNEVFMYLPKNYVTTMYKSGVRFYPWLGGSHRFVCNWQTSEQGIADIKAALNTR